MARLLGTGATKMRSFHVYMENVLSEMGCKARTEGDFITVIEKDNNEVFRYETTRTHPFVPITVTLANTKKFIVDDFETLLFYIECIWKNEYSPSIVDIDEKLKMLIKIRNQCSAAGLEFGVVHSSKSFNQIKTMIGFQISNAHTTSVQYLSADNNFFLDIKDGKRVDANIPNIINGLKGELQSTENSRWQAKQDTVGPGDETGVIREKASALLKKLHPNHTEQNRQFKLLPRADFDEILLILESIRDSPAASQRVSAERVSDVLAGLRDSGHLQSQYLYATLDRIHSLLLE
jgi:hypothetical protein